MREAAMSLGLDETWRDNLSEPDMSSDTGAFMDVAETPLFAESPAGGPYDVLVVDPPWNQGKTGRRSARPNQGTRLDYATLASSSDQAMGSAYYSGQVGRWTELTLYKTQGGKFVCHQIGRTQWQGERDRFSGKVCETLDEVREFFGHRWLAKDLYAKADIEDVVEVA